MAKYREVIEVNLFQSENNLNLVLQFTFQHDNDWEQSAKIPLHLQDKTASEWPNWSQDLNPLSAYVQRQFMHLPPIQSDGAWEDLPGGMG